MLANLMESSLHIALADGDLDEVMRLGRELRHRVVGLGVGGLDYLVMGAAAIEAGDVVSLDEAVAVAGRGPDSGRLNRLRADALNGGLPFIRGEPDGLSAFDRASATFRAEGIRFNLALALRARAMLAPDAPDAAAIAQEARQIIDELGAVMLLRGLPEARPDKTPGPDATGEPQEAVAID